jgi:hypothetical protein
MLKTSAGDIIGNVPRIPVRGGEVGLEALTVDDTALSLRSVGTFGPVSR